MSISDYSPSSARTRCCRVQDMYPDLTLSSSHSTTTALALRKSTHYDYHLLQCINVIFSSHLRQIANPAPLGLFSFASTTLILSFINVQARGVSTVNYFVRATSDAQWLIHHSTY